MDRSSVFMTHSTESVGGNDEPALGHGTRSAGRVLRNVGGKSEVGDEL